VETVIQLFAVHKPRAALLENVPLVDYNEEDSESALAVIERSLKRLGYHLMHDNFDMNAFAKVTRNRTDVTLRVSKCCHTQQPHARTKETHCLKFHRLQDPLIAVAASYQSMPADMVSIVWSLHS
jgi:hypothetical protein